MAKQDPMLVFFNRKFSRLQFLPGAVLAVIGLLMIVIPTPGTMQMCGDTCGEVPNITMAIEGWCVLISAGLSFALWPNRVYLVVICGAVAVAYVIAGAILAQIYYAGPWAWLMGGFLAPLALVAVTIVLLISAFAFRAGRSRFQKRPAN